MPAPARAYVQLKPRTSRASRATEKPHETHGDVFDDLGFSPKKAASLKLKADLHQKIIKRAREYSQQELQTILHETQSRVSQLMRGKIAGFTLDMLIFYADRLGIHAELKTKELRKPAHPHVEMVAAR
ncbi:MAG: helix-turn-helix domain-containing protein [Acidobacteriia bacterium]|nr:helix-turn-helix domain-containing protein [Terriglobia bacterium]